MNVKITFWIYSLWLDQKYKRDKKNVFRKEFIISEVDKYILFYFKNE